MRNRSVCLRCGTIKYEPFAKCRQCGFRGGTTYDEKARSFMLSEEYLRRKKKIAQPEVSLEKYAKKIQSNETIDFDPKEVTRLSDEQLLLEDVPPYQTLRIALFCLAFLAIPIVAIVVWLY